MDGLFNSASKGNTNSGLHSDDQNQSINDYDGNDRSENDDYIESH